MGTFRLIPTFARKPQDTDKKETPSKHNPRKQEPALPKSLNRFAAKYPSQPGVEGAPARPARLTARGTSPVASIRKERKRHLCQVPESQEDELNDEVWSLRADAVEDLDCRRELK